MKTNLAILIIVVVRGSVAFAQANHVVISEVAPMGGNSSTFNSGEFVELYNPLYVDVTFGPDVQLVSGNTTGSNAAVWQVSLAGKTIKAYGFLLIGDGGVSVALDAAFPSSKNLVNGSSSNACVQLRDGNSVIDAFAWNTGTTLSGEGTPFTPSNVNSDHKSLERKSGPLATSHTTTGNAWDTNDNSADFFENTSAQANPQNSSSPIAVNPYGVGPSGPGSASITPGVWKYSQPTTITIVFKVFNDTAQALKIVKPGIFSWSFGSITTSPDSISKTQNSDTLIFANFFLKSSDSLIVTIPNVTSVDSTNEFSLSMSSSKNGSTFGQLTAQPTTLVYGLPRSISVVKRKELNGVHSLLGKWAVTRGIITAANEFGGPSYLQDGTAGMAVFDSSVSLNVEHGDDVVLLGKVAPFNDLFEFAPSVLLEKVSEGNSFDTAAVTISQLNSQPLTGVEPYEGRLVRINGITSVTTTTGSPATSWAVSGSGTNYNIADATGTMQVRISPRINLANLPTPVGNFDLVCVVGQFGTAYQVLPRSIDDVIPEGNGPRFSSPPTLTAISKTSLSFTWTTDVAGSSIIKYGLTTSYDSTFTDTNKVTNHSVIISNLTPATIYQMQFGSANSGGTTLTQNGIYSTASQSSTGTMNVYFTKSVNMSLSTGENAVTTNVSQKLLNRISLARFSIDAALYSLSGSVGAAIADSLIAAKNRGVKVRVIGEYDNRTTAPWRSDGTGALQVGGISVIFDNYDATNAGAGYMHNKFLVFDNRDRTSDADDWVWTGSWNATDPGNNNDAQNVIEIQDRALANAYTLEFNEMWGSDSLTPNAATSRFGARKLDNTPHQFVINGTSVELYFSPSDRTTGQIIRTIGKANYSVDIALLSFTRNDIANAVISRKKAGLKVHALADIHDASWSVFDTLAASGVDVRVKGSDVSGFLHHKYGIIDAEQNFVTQYVITGSHNWSSNAENSNNENTLIIQSNRIANLFLQEFGARYAAAGGTDVLSGVEREDSGILPTKFALRQNYPNPFNPTTVIRYQLPIQNRVKLLLYDILGREVQTLVDEDQSAGTYLVTLDASKLSSGVYFYRFRAGNFVETKKMLLLR